MKKSELIPGRQYLARNHSGGIIPVTLTEIEKRPPSPGKTTKTVYICRHLLRGNLILINSPKKFVSTHE